MRDMLCNLVLCFRYLFFISGHQNIFASDVIFMIPEGPKCSISNRRRLRSIGMTIWSSTNTRPHLIDSLSKTARYPSGNVSRSSLRILFLTRVTSGSISVFALNVFRSIIKSNSAFLKWSSVIFLFLVSFPTIWLIWKY